MKKLLSVVLSVALVVTAVVTCFTFNANAEDNVTDYVKNGDFEKYFAVNDPNGPAKYSDSTYGWGAQVKASHRVHGTETTTTADKHSGNQSFLVAAIWNNSATYQTEVPGGKTVEISFWAKKLHGSPKTTITGLSELNSGTIKNGTVLVEDCNFNITDTWQRFSKTVTLEADNKGIELLFASGDDACFYIDDLSIKEAVATNAVVSTNGNINLKQGGTAAVSTGAAAPGGKVTYTATPNEGFTFDGWYKDGKLISSDASYEYTANENTTLTANFTGTISEYVTNGDFEKGFSMSSGKKPGDYDSSAYGWVVANNICPANWGYSNRTKAEAAKDGSLGLSIATANWDNNSVSYKTAITAGLMYRISFDAKLGNTFNNEESTTAPKIGVYNHNNLTGNSFKSGSKLAEFTPSLTKEWTKVTKVVQAEDGKDVLELDFSDATAGIYIDNFSIESIELLDSVNLKVLSNGVESNDAGKVLYGDLIKGKEVTFTAMPEVGCEFLGWFKDADSEAISTELTYTAIADESLSLIAKFKGDKNYFTDGSFEDASVLDIHAESVTDATDNGWYTTVGRQDITNWGIFVTNEEHKNGENSLKLGYNIGHGAARVIKVDGGKIYKVGFWMKSTGATVNGKNEVATLNNFRVLNSNTKLTLRHNDSASTTDVSGGDYTEVCTKQWVSTKAGEWEYKEYSVATKEGQDYLTILWECNFDPNLMNIYLDDISVKVNDIADVDGNGTIEDKDVQLFREYIAGWDVEVNTSALDVNRDGTVDYKDIDIIARYLAGWDIKF